MLYEINNGEITLYVEKDYTGKTFTLVGFTVKRIPGLFYTDWSPMLLEGLDLPEGSEAAPIMEAVREYYLREAALDSKDYIEKKLSKKSEIVSSSEAFSAFWRRAMEKAGKPVEEHEFRDANFSKVVNGLVEYTVGSTICRFNFITGEAAGYFSIYDSRRQAPLTFKALNVLYSGDEPILLVEEMDRRGIAPPAYTELARLNRFLDGKRKAELITQDGTAYELEARRYVHSLTASDILHLGSRGDQMYFQVYKSERCKPLLPANVALKDIAFIRCGKKRHQLNHDALKNMEGQEPSVVRPFVLSAGFKAFGTYIELDKLSIGEETARYGPIGDILIEHCEIHDKELMRIVAQTVKRQWSFDRVEEMWIGNTPGTGEITVSLFTKGQAANYAVTGELAIQTIELVNSWSGHVGG